MLVLSSVGTSVGVHPKVTAVLGSIVITEPPTHPCKLPGFEPAPCTADVAGRAATQLYGLCMASGAPVEMCPAGWAPPAEPAIDWLANRPEGAVGDPLFSMEVKLGGLSVFGARLFQRSAALAVRVPIPFPPKTHTYTHNTVHTDPPEGLITPLQIRGGAPRVTVLVVWWRRGWGVVSRDSLMTSCIPSCMCTF